MPYAMRSPEEIASYFDGLELVEPGLVDVTRWRLDTGETTPLHNLVGSAGNPRNFGRTKAAAAGTNRVNVGNDEGALS